MPYFIICKFTLKEHRVVKRPARLSLGIMHYLYNVRASEALLQPVLVLGEVSSVSAQITKQEYDAVRSFLANNLAEQVIRERDLQCNVQPPDSAPVPALSLLTRTAASEATSGVQMNADGSIAVATAPPVAPGVARPNTRRLVHLAFTLRNVEAELAGLARLELIHTRLTVVAWDGDLKVFNLSMAEARVLDLAPGGGCGDARGRHPLAVLQRVPRLPLAVLDIDAGTRAISCTCSPWIIIRYR